jgi:hypothetical protein
MVKTTKYYKCPRCGKESRRRQNRVVKKLSYPDGNITVRTRQEIQSVPDAWAYASEVCLHMSKMVLEYPPTESEDPEFAEPLYDHFRTVAPHTDEEIAEFETIHREVIAAKMATHESKENIEKTRQLPDYDVLPSTDKRKPIRTEVAPDAGRITRMSLAFLYGSIVCSVISNTHRDLPVTDFGKIYAQAIYTHYSLFYADKRMRGDWISWFELMADAEDGGYGWSAWKHRVKVSGEKGDAEIKITPKHMKRMKSKVLRKSQDVLNYLPMFEQLFLKYGRFVKTSILQTVGFRKYFHMLQFRPYQRDILYEYENYIHIDKSLKPNRHTILREVMASEEKCRKRKKRR